MAGNDDIIDAEFEDIPEPSQRTALVAGGPAVQNGEENYPGPDADFGSTQSSSSQDSASPLGGDTFDRSQVLADRAKNMDCFKVLGVNRDATEEDIDRAYQARYQEPDANKRQLLLAAQVLNDPKARKLHEEMLDDQLFIHPNDLSGQPQKKQSVGDIKAELNSMGRNAEWEKAEALAARAKTALNGEILDCFAYLSLKFSDPSSHAINWAHNSLIKKLDAVFVPESKSSDEAKQRAKEIQDLADLSKEVLLNKRARKIHLHDLRKEGVFKISKKQLAAAAALAVVAVLGVNNMRNDAAQKRELRDYGPPAASTVFKPDTLKSDLDSHQPRNIETNGSTASYRFNRVQETQTLNVNGVRREVPKKMVHYEVTIPTRDFTVVSGQYCYQTVVTARNRTVDNHGEIKSGATSTTIVPRCFAAPIGAPR